MRLKILFFSRPQLGEEYELKPTEPEAIFEGILHFMSNPRGDGKIYRNFIEKQYTWDITVEELERIFKRIV